MKKLMPMLGALVVMLSASALVQGGPILLLDLDGGDGNYVSANVAYGSFSTANLVGVADDDSQVMSFSSLLLEAGVTANYSGTHDVYGGTTVVNLDDDGVPIMANGEQKANNQTPDELRWRGESSTVAGIGVGAFYFSLNSETSRYVDLDTITNDTSRTGDNNRLLVNLSGAGWYISQEVGGDIDLDAAEIAALQWDQYTGTGIDLRHTFSADGTMAALGLEEEFVVNIGYWVDNDVWRNSPGGLFLDDMDVTAVFVIPEPSAFALLGLAGLMVIRRRNRT